MKSKDTFSSPRPEPVRRPQKRSELVAREIVRDIVSQGLQCKDKLPTEAEMLVRYNVSRSSLREALRLLEVQGLITIRPGPGAGTLVGNVDASNLASTMMMYLHMGQATFGDLLNAWLMVEPLLAKMAAESNDRQRVSDEMSPFLEGACGEQRELAAGLNFHDVVAVLAGNGVLTLMLGAIGFLVTEQVRLSIPDFQLSDDTVCAHEQLAKAIIDGNGAEAFSLMHDHVKQVMEEIQQQVPGRLEKPILLDR